MHTIYMGMEIVFEGIFQSLRSAEKVVKETELVEILCFCRSHLNLFPECVLRITMESNKAKLTQRLGQSHSVCF